MGADARVVAANLVVAADRRAFSTQADFATAAYVAAVAAVVVVGLGVDALLDTLGEVVRTLTFAVIACRS